MKLCDREAFKLHSRLPFPFNILETQTHTQFSVLDRLTVSNLFRLEPELFDVLDQVRQEPLTRLLVVDNAAALFRDALMGATAQGEQ